ncbi:SusC/RagA family TonB-linked outer membrane protein [Hymenobacter sp. YC55]|uniref:SusC/RagA family TonB-linked outer membrane protein n=1 Tax=Hymenobacter sp. YC55 TaxID=3034019 RepID=UPI0023F970CC|nr:SusC/RagA family TonB-linked outer membrane protein [Hymenobacter sp. YC55]MDF7810271.1 SusC/RagA family TonB-linked outer membrane protein [Hymenobacter sp. YC55]
MKQKLLLTSVLTVSLLQQGMAQSRAISGKVTDQATGQGLPGVTVLAKGTSVGVSTNADGGYSISVPAGTTVLTFSSIGYAAIERPIGDAAVINVGLGADTKQLGEVVVTGALGIQRQAREIGYATSTIDAKELNQARVTNVTNGLAGKVSGLQIQTVNNGINPSVRITLRGTRSLTGENQALVVIDGVQTTQDVLTALNPDDIADITILKGANAAALYGSQATNGALIITTKRGGTTPSVTFSHTSQLEQISFWPKFQNEFGPGSSEWIREYTPYENQQYGDRYDGSIRELGYQTLGPNNQNTIQSIEYKARPNERKDFFNTGYQMQNNVSFSGGDKDTKIFVSYQNVKNKGVLPKDQYDRNTFRANASRQMNKLSTGMNVSFAQAKVDQSNGAVYDQLLNTSALIPITSYKDWRNNVFANPNGYYNEYYANPYFTLDNNRRNIRQSTLIGNIDLGYKINDWLSAQYRIGLTYITQDNKNWQDKFTYTASTLGRPVNSRSNIAGGVTELNSSVSRLNSDLFINIVKQVGDISIKGILGNNVQMNNSQFLSATANALAVPGIFNVGSNRVGEATVSQGRYRYRQAAFFGDLTLGYKDMFFLHGSARQEEVSVLNPENRSYFYPSVDASVVLSEVIPALKSVAFFDYGKLRGGYSKVGQVNLGGNVGGVANNFGAYSIAPVYNPGSGYPFGSAASYTLSDRTIVPNLKPEFTHSTEVGTELSFLKQRLNFAATYYYQLSINQTINANIAPSGGFTNYLLNAGKVQNNGVELDLNVTPVEAENGLTWRVGLNYNYNNNKVLKITDQTKQLPLTTGGDAQVYAIEGQPYPVLQGTDYNRDNQGRVILTYIDLGEEEAADGSTYQRQGWVPSQASQLTTFGNTLPKHKYGFNTSLTFKGITLAAQAEYRTGYYVYHGLGSTMDFTGASARSASTGREPFVMPNSSIQAPDGTYVANTTNLTPGGAEFWANSSYNRNIAANYVTKGDFFKLREVSLNYSLPASLLSNTRFIKGVTLNLYGRNLYTWVPKANQFTDPEFSFTSGNGIGINNSDQTPPTRFYGASLSATF